jgi:hypothetical protein
MPEQNSSDQPTTVSQRQSKLGDEIERLVASGTEHPTFEFKRQLSYSKENPVERADFIKLVQGMANAQPGQERVLVIGGDQRDRAFCEVKNIQEFDPARISPVLEAYLNPVPLFECFNSFISPDGKSYCALVLAADQPRPIVIEKQLDKEGKSYLTLGDIWIKKNTGLCKATRTDIEAIYEAQVEAEGERLARARFAHMRDEFYASATFIQKSGVISSLASSDAEFSHYVQNLIANHDSSRFLITLEELRDELIENWPASRSFTTSLVSRIQEYQTTAFVPALRRIIELGMRIIKHQGDTAWLTSIMKLLAEVFEVSRRLQIIAQYSPTSEHQLLTASPAVDSHIGAWCCAAYALRRKRYIYFAPIIRTYVTPHFWEDLACPLMRSLLAQPYFTKDIPIDWSQGRISYYWDRRVSSLWPHYFGSDKDEFVKCSLFTDVGVEFNSFIVQGMAAEKSKVIANAELPALDYRYYPATYMYDFNLFNSFLEQISDELSKFPKWEFLENLLSLPATLVEILKDTTKDQRELIMGKFLVNLVDDARQRNGPAAFFLSSLSPRLLEFANKARARPVQQ